MQATATGLLALVIAIWIAKGQGALWRLSTWSEAVDDTARALGGEVRPLWQGWRVQRGRVRVEWRGGLRGPVTRVRVGRLRREEPGLLDATAVVQMVEALEST